MTRSRSLIMATAALFAVLLGVASGVWAQAQPVAAACPNTECDSGIYCRENPSRNTYCASDGTTCWTQICEPE